MFKKILSGLSKFFTKERIIILIVFLILAWALYNYAGSKSMVLDRMSDGSATAPSTGAVASASATSAPAPSAGGAAPLSAPNGYSQKAVANPSDLLPNDVNSQWASLNPNSMNQGDILMPDLLQAGYHIGLDTIGQSLRNPNLQLRSDPVIPKSDIGPWNQSTIEPDLGRVPLELGAGTR
jgi:hypothetical protein